MATFLCAVYLAASEWIPLQGSKGEVLLFPRGHKALKAAVGDEESQISKDRVSMAVEVHEKSTPITFNPPEASTPFLWDHLTYDVKTPKGPKRLLDGIQGWAKQGTLTAVMVCIYFGTYLCAMANIYVQGSSGAGKTTLLNVLANRAPTGTIGGNIVKGNHEEGEHSFARKVGYAQQADIHLPTSTVREALEFSATLRQSEKYSLNEKMAYVNEVIRLLDMGDFVDAVVGVPGQGLNVEQRKKVTIGVELAVRPELLLFLDEPTSGLDSNTAWAICKLLRTLARNGQAILCTIHQPSGDLFQMFDKLLLLSQDGKQAYFGDIGPNCETVINYFHGNGARKCHERENPAEWLLEVTKHNTDDAPDWADKWIASKEREDVQSQMQNMKEVASTTPPTQEINQIGRTEFARGFFTQLSVLTKRNLLRDWRTPSYLYSKSLLVIAAVSIGDSSSIRTS
jgi:ATP-binding cassette subfamily G (WHITE) protein 2 (PDR)